jgi:hypothetical protein
MISEYTIMIDVLWHANIVIFVDHWNSRHSMRSGVRKRIFDGHPLKHGIRVKSTSCNAVTTDWIQQFYNHRSYLRCSVPMAPLACLDQPQKRLPVLKAPRKPGLDLRTTEPRLAALKGRVKGGSVSATPGEMTPLSGL